MTHLRRAALAYAERLGWHVHPIRPDKRPYTAHGHRDATTDLGQIEGWWRRWPRANIGISCAASGLVALDVDPRNGGDLELDALIAQHGELPETVAALTGGGGMHHVFAAPRGLRWLPKVGPGLELKHCGYIIVAPSACTSVHTSGRSYSWELSSHPLDLEPASPPGWLVRLGGRLALRQAPTEGEVGEGLLGRAFELAGLVRRQVDATRIAVVCPWEHEHTTGPGSTSSTIVFASSERHGRGWFHCSHASCAHRRPSDVLEALHEIAPDALRTAVTARGIARVIRSTEAIEMEGA